MLKNIIEFSARNRVWIVMFFLFLSFLGLHLIKKIPIDAIPDLSETQVIIYVKWNKSPKIIDDQITYPIITSLVGTPKVKTIRGFSDYGYSFIYVIFEENVDIYWARSRVLEYLDKIKSQLPKDALISIGPDATGVGWVFQYVLVDKKRKSSLSEIRSYHDFNIKYQFQSIEGVSEVATIGGFEKEYQVTIDPNKLFVYKVSLHDIIRAIKFSNNESDARIIEYSGFEYMIRLGGYLKDINEIKKIPVKVFNSIPITIEDVATVEVVPQVRRGVGDFNGEGDAVSGIVIARHKENALNVIEKVKERLNEISKTLPEGMEIISVYDRSDLIKNVIKTLKDKLIKEIIIVSLVIFLFLLHIPSAFIAIVTIPVSIILCFICMYLLKIESNIMSLAGIAISIGVLVDGSIIEVENAYKKIELWNERGRKEDFYYVRLSAIEEVVPSVFFSLLIVAVSFVPIFMLNEQEGKLFSPLAWTKVLIMLSAAFLALTLDPALRMMFSKKDYFNFRPKFVSYFLNLFLVGKYYKEEEHPINKLLYSLYLPICKISLEKTKFVLFFAFIFLVLALFILKGIKSEFMPKLNEGTILYMPTTFPGISIEQAQKVLSVQNKILKSFPEVLHVYGKAGRANTSTDPAPLSMIETIVVLKPQNEWREKKRWYSDLPLGMLKDILRNIWHDKITIDELISEMDSKVKIPGFVNSWTMPIKGRIDMLTTGIKTPIGIKVIGDDLYKTQEIAIMIEKLLKDYEGIRSVYSERVSDGYFIEIEPIRERLARYNINIDEFHELVSNSIGSMPLTYTIEKRERYPISVRYKRNLRENLESISNIPIIIDEGISVPLSFLANVKFLKGPSMIRNENGFYSTYIYIDCKDENIEYLVESIKEYLSSKIKLPPGYNLIYSGQYENIVRVKERMRIVIPLVLFIIVILVYINTKSIFSTALILSIIPFSLTGAFLFIYFMGYNLSTAVWVGIVALAGLDAETATFMLLYLELSYKKVKEEKEKLTDEDLKKSIYYGAVKRIRPKIMTVSAAICGLLPIMFSFDIGSEVMKKIAAPMIGGLITSFLAELIIYPAVWYIYLKKKENIL